MNVRTIVTFKYMEYFQFAIGYAGNNSIYRFASKTAALINIWRMLGINCSDNPMKIM